MNLIESAIVSPNNKIIITGGSTPVSGYLTENFILSGSNEWSPVMETSSFQEQFKKFSQMISSKTSKGFSVDYPIQSRKTWQKSSIPQFNFRFVILAFNNTDNVLDKVKSLLEGVYPKVVGNGNSRAFTPPNDYNGNLNLSIPKGTWRVTIGNRLITIDKLVMIELEYNISQKKLPNGKPLFVEVSVTFEPAEEVSIDEVMKWIGG